MQALSPVEVVRRLESTASKKDKEQIVRDAWEAGCTEFFEGAKLAYDKLVAFGVAKLPTMLPTPEGIPAWDDVPWPIFMGLAMGLKNADIVGNSKAGKLAVHEFAQSCHPQTWDGWYRRVLLKDLSCGITEGTINRVLDEYGPNAARFKVPVFAIQRAHDGQEPKNKKRVRGLKYLDYKFDGARLATFIERTNPEVSQYTRSGNKNKQFNKITEALAGIRHLLPRDVVLDGEIMSEDFNRLMTMLNRKTLVDTSDAVLIVFDVVGIEEFKQGFDPRPQRERHEELLRLSAIFEANCEGRVVVLDKTLVDLDTEEGQAVMTEMKEVAAMVVDPATGRTRFEGIMVKDPEAPYVGKKGYHWLKVKPWIEVDLTVVGLADGDPDGKRAGKVGAIVCEGLDEDSGKFISVNVGGGLSDEMIDEFTANPSLILGQIVTIRADAISNNEDGTHSLRFPRFERFRSIVGNPGEKD